jgi:sugar lactone lactonase YvrE
LNAGGRKTVVDEGIAFSSICLTPDQSLLLADNSKSRFVYSFHINPDGTLADRQAYHHLCIPDGAMESGAAGMAVDTRGTLFVITDLGIQMCDQAGRVQGIIAMPRGVELSHVVFGGAGFNEMFAVSAGRILKRQLKTTGAISLKPPIKPAAPSL